MNEFPNILREYRIYIEELAAVLELLDGILVGGVYRASEIWRVYGQIITAEPES
ncbi:hypothetical protein WAI453_010780 [Rhynchosporium graminicola]